MTAPVIKINRLDVAEAPDDDDRVLVFPAGGFTDDDAGTGALKLQTVPISALGDLVSASQGYQREVILDFSATSATDSTNGVNAHKTVQLPENYGDYDNLEYVAILEAQEAVHETVPIPLLSLSSFGDGAGSFHAYRDGELVTARGIRTAGQLDVVWNQTSREIALRRNTEATGEGEGFFWMALVRYGR